MNIFKAAVVQANAQPGSWQPHPTRKHQQIQRVSGLASLWSELKVPLNIVVVRWQDKQTKEWEYVAFACTDLTLTARQIIELYQTRPEIEEDYRQLKSEAWHLEGFYATKLVQILWHVILTLLAYNLFQAYANTKAGKKIAEQPKQKLERQMSRNPPTYLLVCTREAYGLFETKSLLYILLDLPDDVRQRIRSLLPQHLK